MFQPSPCSIPTFDRGRSQRSESNVRRLGISVHYLQTVFLDEIEKTPGLSRDSKIYDIEDLRDAPGLIRQKSANVICPVDGEMGAAYVHCLGGEDNVGAATHLLSYSWSYSIGDIVDSLVGYCTSTHNVTKRTYVWICAFCNNLHRVVRAAQDGSDSQDFVLALSERALGIGHMLVLMSPWNSPGYLIRVWCMFEFHTALNLGCIVTVIMPPRDKEAFRNHLRGKSLTTFSDLEDLLPAVELQQAQAALEADRESILNWVQKDPASDPLFIANNRRVMESLVKWAIRCEPALANLTDKGSGDVICNSNEASFMSSDHGRRAVSVHYLQTTFLEEVRSTPGLTRKSTIAEIENLENDFPGVIRRKGLETVCPFDKRKGAAYVCCLSGDDNVGTATHMLSYTWHYTIGDIVDTLVDYCATHHRDPKRTYVWMCCLCVNQHRVAEKKRTERSGALAPPNVNFFAEFGERVRGIGEVLAMMAPWNEPKYLRRIWCIYEVYMARNEGCKFTIVMPPREREALRSDLFGSGGKGMDALYDVLAQTRIQNARAYADRDRDEILNMIAQKPGYVALNMMVNEELRKWARQVFSEALQTSRDGDEAKFCNDMSSILTKNDQHDASLEMARKAVTILTNSAANETSRRHHELLARSHNNIGTVLRKKGDHIEGLVEHRRALAIALESLGNDHAETATCYSEIGTILCLQGDFDGALAEHQKALAIVVWLEGKHHPEVAKCHCNIGAVLSNKGDFEGALEEHRKALSIFEASLGTECIETANTHSNIGTAYLHLGNFVSARLEVRKALATFELLLGKGHADTAACYCNLGCIYHCLRAYSDALVEFRRALVVYESVFGTEHPDTAVVLGNIDRVLAAMKK